MDKRTFKFLEKLKMKESVEAPNNYVEDPYSTEDMVQEVSERSGALSPEDVRKIHFIESSEGKMLQNPGSSAKGNFQIIDSTRKEIKKELANKGVTEIPVNPLRKDALLAGELMNKYKNKLENAGIEPNLENMYLMHNRGVSGALNAIKNPKTDKNKQVWSKVRALLKRNPPAREPDMVAEQVPSNDLLELLREE